MYLFWQQNKNVNECYLGQIQFFERQIKNTSYSKLFP